MIVNFELKPEVKKAWQAALRSGEYKQDRSVLRSNNGWCCLGVLADLYIKENKNAYWKREVTKTYLLFAPPLQARDIETYLPQVVYDWAGKATGKEEFNVCCGPRVSIPDNERNPFPSLAALNDSQEYDFNQIADLIEEFL